MKPKSEQDCRRTGEEFKVYGNNFALDVFGGMNKASTAHVVNLKIARKQADSNEYNWAGDWIWVQVSGAEIAPFLSVLLGYKKSVHIEHFNNGVMKHLELRLNTSESATDISYVLSMRTNENSSARAVKIEQTDRVRMSIFFFRVFMKMNGGVSQDVLYMMLRDIYGRSEIH